MLISIRRFGIARVTTGLQIRKQPMCSPPFVEITYKNVLIFEMKRTSVEGYQK